MMKLEFPDSDHERARIIRALFDVTDLLSRDPDHEGATGTRARLVQLCSDVQGLDDPGFAAAFDRALQLLLPAGPGGAWS